MWNPSASWQRRVRLTAGLAVLIVALAGPPVCLLLGGASVREAAEAVTGLVTDEDCLLPVDLTGAPPDLRARDLAGLAVYRQLPDGSGTLVGRLVVQDGAVAVRVAPAAAAACQGGGQLLHAPRLRDLEDVLAVLLAPDGVDGELDLARAQLVPTLRRQLLARMQDRLDRTLADLVAELPERHGREVEVMLEDLEEALAPETERLIDALVERSWKTVGFWGVTVGVARKATEGARRLLYSGEEKLRAAFGSEPPEDRPSMDFLSQDRTEELRRGLEHELETFWNERGDAILETASDVLEEHSSTTLASLKETWLAELQERVLEESWREAREPVLEAVSSYATDFARRRLITTRGGPTLSLAFAIRSTTHITRRPLLVLQPGGEAGPLRVQRYVTALRPRER
jgi:hypothetical protein